MNTQYIRISNTAKYVYSFIYVHRKRCLPFSAQQLAESMHISAGKLLKHLSTVFSAETQTQEEMTESNYLDSEKMCAEYRDELDDYVTVTDY